MHQFQGVGGGSDNTGANDHHQGANDSANDGANDTAAHTSAYSKTASRKLQRGVGAVWWRFLDWTHLL